MTNQTMRDCRAIVDGRVAVAQQVVASQRVLIETLRRHGQPTLSAETALVRYRAVRVLHTPRDEQVRCVYDTLSFLSPSLVDQFEPDQLSLAQAVDLARQ